MSDFELEDLGGGRFALTGEMSFATVDRILAASTDLFGRYADVQVDLAGVGKADSAGLALLLEWKALARRKRDEVCYANVPDGLMAIARTADVGHFI